MSLRLILDEFNADRPLDLGKDIESFLSIEKPSFRAEGRHPSEIGSDFFCVRKKVIQACCAEHNIPSTAGVDGKLQLIFHIGHALHDYYREKYLGPMGVLKGIWKCSRCHDTVEGFMPKEPCSCIFSDDFCPILKPSEVLCRNNCAKERELGLDPIKVADRGGCIHCGIWGKWEYQEIAISIPEWNIVGHIDGIIVVKGEDGVLDIKTIKPDKWDTLEKPYKSYIKQLTIYMKAGGWKFGYLAFVNKSTGQVKTFRVDYDERIYDEIIAENVVGLDKALANKEWPKMNRMCKPNSYMRENCEVSQFCIGCRKYATMEARVLTAAR